MVTKLTEQAGCTVAEFIELKRFTLAITEEVKSELKPLLTQAGMKLILNLKHIEFIDSSGIGCIISLVKTAKSNGAEIKLCNLSGDVMDVIELLHLQMIFDIEKDVETSIKSFQYAINAENGKKDGLQKLPSFFISGFHFNSLMLPPLPLL